MLHYSIAYLSFSTSGAQRGLPYYIQTCCILLGRFRLGRLSLIAYIVHNYQLLTFKKNKLNICLSATPTLGAKHT